MTSISSKEKIKFFIQENWFKVSILILWALTLFTVHTGFTVNHRNYYKSIPNIDIPTNDLGLDLDLGI